MKKPRICVDFDGVIVHHNINMGPYHFGPPIDGAREFLQKLRKKGYVVIYSARVNVDPSLVDELEDYMKQHDLPYDEIYYGYGKSEAVAYIDDRAIECDAQNDKNAYKHVLEKIDVYIQRFYDGGVVWEKV